MRRKLKFLLSFLIRQAVVRRPIFLLIVYGGIFAISLQLGFLLRFDFSVPPDMQLKYINSVWWIIMLKYVFLFGFGQFGVLLSYFRLPDVYRIGMALGFSSSLVAIAWYVFPDLSIPPRGVILGDLLLSMAGVVTFRTILRVVRERVVGGRKSLREGVVHAKRVAIVGAGQTGAALAYDLMGPRRRELKPVVFLDDDKSKWRHQIHGLPIIDSPDNMEMLQKRYDLEGIILAMSSASVKRVQEITELATSLGMTADIVPSLGELATGKVKSNRIRPVAIEDLLGREVVELSNAQIQGMLQGKVVMVTGAGGSIGSELCRQISTHAPSNLIMIEQCEVQLYKVEQMLKELGFEGSIKGLVGDVCDLRRMRSIMERYSPAIIFHAAAHKHVPIMEYQPGEAIKNNSFGTIGLADLALELKVEKFVFISTDKAINPTNVMGASKRLAEIYLQSIQGKAKRNGSVSTQFVAVRFGNVLGSSGSVVPLFKKQIEEGGPVTVTHQDVTRYFMTIPEAVGLVLECGTQATGGEIFVLDMGQPVKIMDLARKMIQLSGYTPNRDIEIQTVGLRPGEKLFEELQHRNEMHEETHHPRIFRFSCKVYDYEEVQGFLSDVRPQLETLEGNLLKKEVQRFIPEYKPYMS